MIGHQYIYIMLQPCAPGSEAGLEAGRCSCSLGHYRLQDTGYYMGGQRSASLVCPQSTSIYRVPQFMPLVGIETPPTPLPQASVGWAHSPAGGWWGNPNSDDWRKSLALLPSLCVCASEKVNDDICRHLRSRRLFTPPRRTYTNFAAMRAAGGLAAISA
jgi:hypothetical protein